MGVTEAKLPEAPEQAQGAETTPTYRVKNVFHTLQGEGFWAGTLADRRADAAPLGTIQPALRDQPVRSPGGGHA